MAGDEIDEDTQIALLASLLEPASFTIEEYRSALQEASGDVQRAAEALLLPRVKSSGKRKAGTSLEGWLGRSGGAPATKLESVEGKPLGLSRTAESKESNKKEPVKPSTDAFRKLLDSASRPPAPIKTKALPQPPVRLYTQPQIDSHGLPLSLLTSPLSPSFASALYLAMMEESERWDKNRWYLAGRWVESPHTTTSYCRPGDGYGEAKVPSSDYRPPQKPPPSAEPPEVSPEIEHSETRESANGMVATGARPPGAKYFYSGIDLGQPPSYPPLLAIAAKLIEPVVNAAIKSRPRYPGEYAGDWRANVCGANRYDGANSGVGWHADQLTYLGPYATIASLSLGTPRAFRLRPTDPVDPNFASGKPTRTYEMTLGHNSLVLMNAGCQERYKHTIPPQKALDLFRPGWSIEEGPIPPEEQKTYTSRINITFRDDFHPLPSTGPNGPREGTPICKCGIPMLLRADQKAKARSKMGSPSKRRRTTTEKEESTDTATPEVVDDDMIFFWQCQSPGQTGDMKGCGFFRILDMKAEGRGPCIGDGT